MADFILVHQASTNEKILLNRDHILHARLDKNGNHTIIEFANGAHPLQIVEDLHYVKDEA
jgi:hypothetical protein